MAVKPGERLIGSSCIVTYEAGEAVSPGDVVGVDGGTLRAVNSGDASTNELAVVAHGGGEDAGDDYASGEEVPVHIKGDAVLASVAAGITAGEELAASGTDGELAAGAAGIDAVTDEGAPAGLSTNEDVPAGFAAVNL